MTANELAEKLTTIADKAKALRDAGVVGRVSVDGVSFELADNAPAPTLTAQHDDSLADIDHPDTYGGFIPQRRRGFGEESATDDDADD